jgi:hypothetical protein
MPSGLKMWKMRCLSYIPLPLQFMFILVVLMRGGTCVMVPSDTIGTERSAFFSVRTKCLMAMRGGFDVRSDALEERNRIVDNVSKEAELQVLASSALAGIKFHFKMLPESSMSARHFHSFPSV